MELLKNTYRYQRQVARQTVYHEELTEGIVPDTLPDAARIVDASGIVCVRDWELSSDELLIKCAARVTVLYMTEEDSHLYHMEVPISFSHRVELRGVSPGCDVLCSAALLSADARMLGPRRFSVRIHAALMPRVYVDAEETYPVSVSDGEGVCTRQSVLPYRAVVTAAYKNFTLVEDIDVPEELGGLRSVLRAEMQLRETDVKLLPGRVVVKADAEISVLCETAAGEYRRLQHTFSFTQMAEVPGAEEGQDVDIAFTLRSFELDPALDLSGDSRYLSLSAGVIMNLELSRISELQVLTDLYGTRTSCTPAYRELRVVGCGTSHGIHTSAQDHLDTAAALRRVVDWRMQAEQSAEYLPEERQGIVMTMVSVLCEGEDGSYYAFQRRIPLRFAVDSAPEQTQVCVELRELQANIVPGGIDLRMQAMVWIKSGEDATHTIVDSVEWGEAYPPDEYAGYSVLIRRADGDESLWQIAREYHVDAAALAQANHLEEDAMPEGGALLLIPMRK